MHSRSFLSCEQMLLLLCMICFFPQCGAKAPSTPQRMFESGRCYQSERNALAVRVDAYSFPTLNPCDECARLSGERLDGE